MLVERETLSFPNQADLKRVKITNRTWRDAARVGHVDASKISAMQKDRVRRAQFFLCTVKGWGEAHDETQSDFVKQRKSVGRLLELCKKIMPEFQNWREANEYTRSIVGPIAEKVVALDRQLEWLGAEYTRMGASRPKGKKSASNGLFLNWVWCVADTYQTAGGMITLTSPGSGGHDDYRSHFLEYCLSIIHKEPNWQHQILRNAFGARLDRALTEMRKGVVRGNGQPLVLLAKGRLLRSPT